MAGLKTLETALGYAFGDRRLLERALTHASLTQEENNQRLEFLGDAVLELCISQLLFSQEKKEDEGSLTRRRQQLVCEKALFQVAEALRLGEYLRMQPEMERAGGRQHTAILADAIFKHQAADGFLQQNFPDQFEIRGITSRIAETRSHFGN